MSSLDSYFHIMETIFNCSFDETLIEFGLVGQGRVPFSIFLLLLRLSLESRIRSERYLLQCLYCEDSIAVVD